MTYPPVTIRPRVWRPRQLYANGTFDTGQWPARVPHGFLPAVVEHGGRYWRDGREASYYVGGYRGERVEYDLDAVRECAASLPAGTLYVLDEEDDATQTTTTLRHDPATADQRERRVRQFVAAMRAGNPRVRVALYDQIVTRNYWVLTRAHQARVAYEHWRAGTMTDFDRWAIGNAYRWDGKAYVLDDTIGGLEGRAAYLRWKAASDAAGVGTFGTGRANASAGITDAVDAFTPSEYVYYQDEPIDGYLAEMNAECRRVAGGRSVIPTVWNRFHASGELMPLDFWRRYVAAVLRDADGVLLWDVHDRAYFDVVLEVAADASVA